MNKKIYKQADSRWASKPYPKKGSSFGGNGCGCCACVHVAIEQDSKKNWTPESLRPWMVKQGFAVYGQGTTWSGITKTLKHLGHTNVVCVWDNDPMSKAWKELNKGNRIGVILFDGGNGPDGTRWTSGGHYVAFTDYKIKNGKHYFYCKDSGFRNNDGWFAYENSMKGCIPKMWIVERIKGNAPKPKKPPTKYTGNIPKPTLKKGDKGTSVNELQTFINWYMKQINIEVKIAVDGIFGDETRTWLEVLQRNELIDDDGIYGKITYKKASAYK